MSDPAKYRTKEEVEQYKGRDPLTDVRNIITDMSWYFPFDELPIEHPEFETEEEKKEVKVQF